MLAVDRDSDDVVAMRDLAGSLVGWLSIDRSRVCLRQRFWTLRQQITFCGECSKETLPLRVDEEYSLVSVVVSYNLRCVGDCQAGHPVRWGGTPSMRVQILLGAGSRGRRAVVGPIVPLKNAEHPEMSIANPRWGARGSTASSKLGIDIGHDERGPSIWPGVAARRPRWKKFSNNHARRHAAMDLFVVPQSRFVCSTACDHGHGRRQILWFGGSQLYQTEKAMANQRSRKHAVGTGFPLSDAAIGTVFAERWYDGLDHWAFAIDPRRPVPYGKNGFAERTSSFDRRECLTCVVSASGFVHYWLSYKEITTTRSYASILETVPRSRAASSGTRAQFFAAQSRRMRHHYIRFEIYGRHGRARCSRVSGTLRCRRAERAAGLTPARSSEYRPAIRTTSASRIVV